MKEMMSISDITGKAVILELVYMNTVNVYEKY